MKLKRNFIENKYNVCIKKVSKCGRKRGGWGDSVPRVPVWLVR
jgi:hypothetical protein